jgi:hypothetical protein
VYLPQAQAIHSWGGSRRRSPSIRHGLLSQRAQYLLLRRHRPRWQGALLWLYLLLFTVARAGRAAVRAAGNPSPPLHTAAHLYVQECRWLLRRNKCRHEERPGPL